ncbi:hypothetical protein NPIL_687751 [Nephila pilipes]|uniref:Uncharacterized protein n=1 Tax=Nephila pilipes TaxID=299642 RepID=A0A8X6NIA3_NEPPI|nr:hypothetical protein NPIL_687751 [Nephila pilipes]
MLAQRIVFILPGCITILILNPITKQMEFHVSFGMLPSCDGTALVSNLVMQELLSFPEDLWHIFRDVKVSSKNNGKTSRPLLAPRSKTTIAAWPMGQQGFQKWEIGLPLL